MVKCCINKAQAHLSDFQQLSMWLALRTKTEKLISLLDVCHSKHSNIHMTSYGAVINMGSCRVNRGVAVGLRKDGFPRHQALLSTWTLAAAALWEADSEGLTQPLCTRLLAWQGDRCFRWPPYCLCVHCCNGQSSRRPLSLTILLVLRQRRGILLSDCCLIMEILLIYSAKVHRQLLWCSGIYWGSLGCVCTSYCISFFVKTVQWR